MNAVVFIVAISTLVAILMVSLLIWVYKLSLQAKAERIRRAVEKTKTAVDADHRAARRAMNDAAGQSWRNLSE